MDVSIRGVDEDTWAEFKSNAAKNKLSMAEYLERLLDKETRNWEDVLQGEKTLSDEAADAIKHGSKEIRDTFKMR